jgi:hypothetical protein
MRAMATLAAAVLLGVGTAAAQDRSGDDPPARKPPSGGSWLTRWWPFGRKAEEKKPPPAPEPRRPSAAETARAARVREEAALHRRLAVCDRLREIAAQAPSPDHELWRKADELESLAWQTYTLRTAHLPSSGAAEDTDEDTLARRLGPGARGQDAAALSSQGRGAGDGGRTAERRDR